MPARILFAFLTALTLAWFPLSLAASTASIPSEEFALPYAGRCEDREAIESIREQIARLLPVAMIRAESLLCMPLDRDRIDFRLLDTPIGAKPMTSRMVTFGRETPIVGILIEPILRGSYADSSAVLTTLTHEIVHAIVRQNLQHDDYRKLPEWWQEGVPIYLLQQGEAKLLRSLAHHWDEPEKVLAGFAGDHSSQKYVTGYYFFEELTARVGFKGMQTFVQQTLATSSIAAALESLAIEEEEVWPAAKNRAQLAIQKHTGAVGPEFAHCMQLYKEGRNRRQEAIQCFGELIADGPETYASQVSHYWLAKCYYHVRNFDLARKWFRLFGELPLHYGLLDNVRYFLIKMRETDGEMESARQACEEYMKFFPDGDNRAKVQEILSRLEMSDDP